MTEPRTDRPRNRSLIVMLLGGLLGLIGLVLAIGGAWLALLGGSLYYLLAGLGLVAAGYLLIRGRALGAYIYIGVFALTLIWALWEVGMNGWALVPRVIGPAVLAMLVLLILPLVEPRRWRWVTAGGAAAAVLGLLVVGALLSHDESQAPGKFFPEAASAAFVDPAMALNSGEWPAYGGTYAAQRFSPLAQITPANVEQLERAWVYHTRDLPADMKDNKYGAETTPLKVGDSLYLCTAKNILVSLDPATGRERWRFDPRVADEWIPYTAACRGVAYFAQAGVAATDTCAARVIEGTLDGRLIAVDARTGRPCADFGANGQVDMKRGMGPVFPGMVSITSPPTIVRGVIVTGHQVLDGQKNDAPSGVIQGFDAVTGEKRWAWDMEHPDWSKDPPPGQAYARGTPNMWTIASGDEALGLVYLPMGNSAVDYWSSDRSPAENEYATSLVALDVTTGRPRWHFRAVHNDVWDYDFGGQATLVEFPVGGGRVPAMVLPSKQGDIYILDRRTGRPLFPAQERRVPQGGAEPQMRTATQPFSAYHTLAFPTLEERDMWGMSPIDQMICRIQYRRARYDGMYTPPETKVRTVQYPGYNGGTDWGGIAVDPVRGVIVANYNDMPNYVRLVPRKVANEKGWAPRSE
ncbi:MAG TPA: PQQ-binding-like beta-propeller repeat protein, partial [Sphingomicrobium sp.]|nr:PQQ-binding-like beta-propeller repeat protein [Sphingomicrobium sp.]